MSEPFTVWSLYAPFDRQGAPIMGISGATARAVVVMEAETFKRLIDEHPTLKTARFRIGQEIGAKE